MHELASRALFDEQTRHLKGRLLQVREWTVITASYPTLEVQFEAVGRTSMRVQMGCQDWNELPPTVALLDGDGKGLAVGGAPRGSNILHQGPHDSVQIPFVCMAGTREYHTHSSHRNDAWDNYRSRSGYHLGGILEQIWNGWLKCTP